MQVGLTTGSQFLLPFEISKSELIHQLFELKTWSLFLIFYLKFQWKQD